MDIQNTFQMQCKTEMVYTTTYKFCIYMFMHKYDQFRNDLLHMP